jgi:hypothetical protein
VNEESISDILNDELDIESDDEMDLEIEVETASEDTVCFFTLCPYCTNLLGKALA